MLRIDYATLSKSGGRSVNEDSTGIETIGDSRLFCLADGLGGHSKGEVASQLAVATAIKSFRESNGSDVLSTCFTQAQDAIMCKQMDDYAVSDIKTTLTLLLIQNESAYWGHIGDSRLYHFKKNKLYARTLDHSVPQMLVSAGEIKERDIRSHEDRNRLTRVMGDKWDAPAYELATPVAISHGDVFLLCSDGFWELINEKEMIKLLKKYRSAESWLVAMEDIVLKNGQNKNMDNYSAIAVFIE